MIPVSICGEFQITNFNIRRTPTVTLKVNTIVPLHNVLRGIVNNLFKNRLMFVSFGIAIKISLFVFKNDFSFLSADLISNLLVQDNVFIIWLYRNHNRLARLLETMNPCWSDEKIYMTVREIQIAILNQIWYYEMFAGLLGKYSLSSGILNYVVKI